MLPAEFAFETPYEITVAFAVAVLIGLSKAGFGGTMAILGVATLSLVVSPITAAGILLPVLLVIDVVACWIWRGKWDLRMVWMMLPAGLVGVAVGWATAAYVSDAAVRLIIGSIALVYLATYAWKLRGVETPAREQSAGRASFWSFFAGYGSFIAHSGGPAYQIYAMPLKASPAVFTATSTLFFAIVNVAKLVPYAALGQLGFSNVSTSLWLMPVAAAAAFAGAAIIKRMRAEVFYPVMHLLLLVVTIKLIWDGVTGLGA